jgi:predicted nucleic acid-binding protein
VKVLGCRDRDDAKFLETAIVGQADLLVTGDSDLPSMHPFRTLEILTLAVCMEKYF